MLWMSVCVCVFIPTDVVLLPGKLCVTVVELVHNEGYLW